MRYSLTKKNLIVLENESSPHNWSKILVNGNTVLLKELLDLANLALAYRAEKKAQREVG